MDTEQLANYVKSAITEGISVVTIDTGFLIRFPFNNYKGEPVEISVHTNNGNLVIDDIGLISGLLFELGEHGEDALGHLITRRLTESYRFNMNYNDGIISQEVSVSKDVEKLLDFVQVITSIGTVLPFVSKPRKRIEGRKKLGAQLAREIAQLRLPLVVEKSTKVEGKHEIWDIDYKYHRKEDSLDILILVADLGLKEPKERAAHTVTLASDVLDTDLLRKSRRELRVVYSANGNGNDATRRAADIIEDYQRRIGYKAFNYANPQAKSSFTNLTIQDLSPMKL